MGEPVHTSLGAAQSLTGQTLKPFWPPSSAPLYTTVNQSEDKQEVAEQQGYLFHLPTDHPCSSRSPVGLMMSTVVTLKHSGGWDWAHSGYLETCPQQHQKGNGFLGAEIEGP